MPKIINISPFNRVEGNLEIRVELGQGKVRNAWASGVMFRGFERILIGRDPSPGTGESHEPPITFLC